jgi:hypothetical protein
MVKNCPVCGSDAVVSTVRRERLPVLQNRVFGTRAAAVESPCAPFELATCGACGFSYNGIFRSELVPYDQNYDNEVPSQVFQEYYAALARMLIDRLELSSGTVYDVGCGKGTFLRTLCKLAPGIRGYGIDPSCTPTTEDNFTLIRDVFKPGQVGPDAKLVLLRHVLEHIEEPASFLKMIGEAMPRIPLFVEVPSFEWILRNGAFWDFCYEHCNYFTGKALIHAMERAGFDVQEHQTSFGDQYQWAIGLPGSTAAKAAPPGGAAAIEDAKAYLANEQAKMSAASEMIAQAKLSVVWGMATKGVIFTTLIKPGSIAGGVDINPNKQSRFVPGSGLEIHAPEWLQTLPDDTTIFIMNSNYGEEIRKQISKLGVRSRTVVMG